MPIGRSVIGAVSVYLHSSGRTLDRGKSGRTRAAQCAGRAALAGRRVGHREARRGSAPASPSGSRPTRCGTASRPTCSRAAPTSARCRRCSATPTSPPPRSTPTWTGSTSARSTSSSIRGAEVGAMLAGRVASGVDVRGVRAISCPGRSIRRRMPAEIVRADCPTSRVLDWCGRWRGTPGGLARGPIASSPRGARASGPELARAARRVACGRAAVRTAGERPAHRSPGGRGAAGLREEVARRPGWSESSGALPSVELGGKRGARLQARPGRRDAWPRVADSIIAARWRSRDETRAAALALALADAARRAERRGRVPCEKVHGRSSGPAIAGGSAGRGGARPHRRRGPGCPAWPRSSARQAALTTRARRWRPRWRSPRRRPIRRSLSSEPEPRRGCARLDRARRRLARRAGADAAAGDRRRARRVRGGRGRPARRGRAAVSRSRPRTRIHLGPGRASLDARARASQPAQVPEPLGDRRGGGRASRRRRHAWPRFRMSCWATPRGRPAAAAVPGSRPLAADSQVVVAQRQRGAGAGRVRSRRDVAARSRARRARRGARRAGSAAAGGSPRRRGPRARGGASADRPTPRAAGGRIRDPTF